MTTTIWAGEDPVTAARRVYAKEVCARSFEDDLYLHLNNPRAIVYKDSRSLVLARPIDSLDRYDEITDPSYNAQAPDAWWVYLLVGDFRRLFDLVPHDLPLFGWERNNVPRFYSFNHVKRWMLSPHTSILH